MKQYLWAPVAALFAGQSWAVELAPFLKLESFSHSEPIAVHAIMNGWNAPFDKGKVAFSMNRAEVGLGVENWRFAVFERHDYVFEFAPSTAKLFYDTNNKKALVVGEDYTLKLDSNSFIARGWKVGYQRAWSGFHFGAAVSYLEGLELTDGAASGRATVVAENDYDFSFDVDYYYNEDSLFDREVTSAPKGQGYGLDLSVEGYVLPKWHASFEVRDLFAHINWWDAPRTVATGTSQTKQYDDDGYVVFKPVASGVESNEDVTQTIPTKLFLSTRYEFAEQHALLLDYQDYAIKPFYSVGYRFSTQGKSRFDLLYNATAQAWQLGYQNRWVQLDLVADHVSFEKARTLGLNIALHYTF